MFTKVSINGKTHYVTLDKTSVPTQAERKLSLSNGQAISFTLASADFDQPDENSFVNLSDVSRRLQALMNSVSSNFVERETMVEAFILGLVSNEHSFVLGPPGTAKTSVANQLTKGIGGSLWRIVMNPDVTRDSLVGTIDPIAYEQGTWSRKWSSLATCDVAIIDEVWKSAGNINILLDALEERRVREGDEDRPIPLLSAISMSNELPEDGERQAIYDRFLIRLHCDYITDLNNFEAMLVSSATTTEIEKMVSIGELKLMSACAELLALNAPKDLIDIFKELRMEIGQNGRTVSDRRWKKSLKLACAHALLYDHAPSQVDAKICVYTLWQERDEIADIKMLVMGLSDPFTSEILSAKAGLESLEKSLNEVDPTDLMAKSELSSKADELSGVSEKLMRDTRASAAQVEEMQEIQNALLDWNKRLLKTVSRRS